MTDFRTQLTQNIETYVGQRYCPTTGLSNLRIDIGEKITAAVQELLYAARMKPTTGSCAGLAPDATRNNNGYYYFQ